MYLTNIVVFYFIVACYDTQRKGIGRATHFELSKNRDPFFLSMTKFFVENIVVGNMCLGV